jgi:hypothetical protein
MAASLAFVAASPAQWFAKLTCGHEDGGGQEMRVRLGAV